MAGPFKHSVEELTLPAGQAALVNMLGGPGNPPKTKYRTAEGSTLLYSRLEKWDGTSKLVIVNHGRSASSNQFGLNSGPGLGSMALARTGRYIVLSIDGGPTGTEWGSPMAMTANRDAITWAQSIGAAPGKYAALGWSMGGLATLVLAMKDPLLTGAWLWVPAIDLDYFNSTAGYVPDHGAGVANNATWTNEISSNSQPGAYRAQSTSQGATVIPALGTPANQGATITLLDARRFNDGKRGRPGIGITSAPIITYGSKDDTHLYQCVSSAAGYTLPTGSACTQNFGAGSEVGHSPYKYPADFSPAIFGATRKINLALTSDDPTIPPAIADAWLAKVNNPNIKPTSKSKTLGGHASMFGYYTDQEIVDFYDSLDWS